MAPKDVDKCVEMDLWLQQEESDPQVVTRRNPNMSFKIGDRVKLAVPNKNIFDKGYIAKFTDETFVISRVLYTEPMQYKVKTLTGNDVTGSWYAAELQKV